MGKIATAPSLSKARNTIKRALRELIDSSPSMEELDELWEHFQYCCAYCGLKLLRDGRAGTLDHLDSSATGGSAAIGNRALSCGTCNGDEKREMAWREFLAFKCQDPTERLAREALILGWQQRNPYSKVKVKLQVAWATACREALAAFDNAVDSLREAVKGTVR